MSISKKQRQKKYRENNREKLRKKAREYRRKHPKHSTEIRYHLIERMGSKCKVCGFDDIRALEIHHTIPRNGKPANYSKNMNINDLLLVCCNCHTIIHKKEIGDI